MVWQPGCYSSLSCYPEEGEWAFTKGAIEPSTGDAGLYSNVFVAPKHTGGL